MKFYNTAVIIILVTIAPYITLHYRGPENLALKTFLVAKESTVDKPKAGENKERIRENKGSNLHC
jgi:hypothetical protein